MLCISTRCSPGVSSRRKTGYAISAAMSPPLRAEIERLPELTWQLEREELDDIREWTLLRRRK